MAAQTGPALPDGADERVRRLRLPADRRTPAAARALVRSVLLEAGLDDLLDEALLLTTEVSTNAVEHAGTELDIEVVTDPYGLTVTVSDFAVAPNESLSAGVRNDAADISKVPTRGRGLLLVDHFASRWGTTYQPNGKGVWFRLDRRDGPDPLTGQPRDAQLRPTGATPPWRSGPAPSRPDPTAAATTAPNARALDLLMRANPDPTADDPLPEFAAALLAGLAELLGAAGATVWLDRGDGAGSQALARYGRQPRAGRALVTAPLSTQRPYVGRVELDVAPSSYAQPLVALVAERLSLHLENDRLRRTDIRRQTWLTFLAEASELLAQSLDVELTTALVPQLVVPRLGQWCAVHVTDEWGRLRLAAAIHADEAARPHLDRMLAESGPDSVLARLREASRTGSQVPLSAPLDGVALPLVARGQRLGTLAVGRHQRHRHDPDEVAVLEDVARRAGLAIENARIHAERRRVAITLQESLLPPVLPVVEGIGFAAEYAPTGDDVEVGGDFYDVLPLPDGRWLVVIGDVSGKGVQAAAVTGRVRDAIRVLVGDGKPLPEALVRLNEILSERGGGRYCTLALAAVGHGPAGRLELTLHLAGHDRPVLIGADGRTSFVGTGGTALGLLDAISTPTCEVILEPGDVMVFYTDGVTERRRGRELFGVERLRASAAPLAGYSAEVVAARLRTAVINFSPEAPRDDIAVLVIRNDRAG